MKAPENDLGGYMEDVNLFQRVYVEALLAL